MKALAAPQGATAVGQAAGTTDVLADAAGWATPGRAKGSADAQQMVPEDARSAPNHRPSDSAWVLLVMEGGGTELVSRLEATGMPGIKEDPNPEHWGKLARVGIPNARLAVPAQSLATSPGRCCVISPLGSHDPVGPPNPGAQMEVGALSAQVLRRLFPLSPQSGAIPVISGL